MGVQTITTPTGEEMVVMSRAEYDTLVSDLEEAFEDGADVAIHRFVMAAARPEDILPSAVSAAILKGHGRIRAYREWRGMARQDLAEASGVTVADLDDLEHGRRLLSRDTAEKLSMALNLPAGWLAD